MQPPYSDDPRANAANIAAWQHRRERHAKKKLERCREVLRQAGVDPDWLNGKPRQ
jgi:hypothetical protein